MVVPRRIRRGEIWLVKLDPTVGSEVQKTRPCVVVSPPEIHDWLRIAIVVPMTTGSHPAPYRMPVRYAGKDGLILLDQVRAVDKSRFVSRSGVLDPKMMSATLKTLAEVFSE